MQYAYRGLGQLIRRVEAGGVVRCTYDALGRRLSKSSQGRVTRWVWEGNTLLHEWTEAEARNNTNSEVVTWLYEPSSFAPLAKLTGEASYSVVTDYLGTPLALYDGQGQAAWEMRLDSYEVVRRGKGQAQDCPFRYQGQYEDVETGLYYNRFRYYDPEAGFYLSQDPMHIIGGLKLYGYVAYTCSWI